MAFVCRAAFSVSSVVGGSIDDGRVVGEVTVPAEVLKEGSSDVPPFAGSGGPLVSPGEGRGGVETVKGSILGKKVEFISPMPTKKSSAGKIRTGCQVDEYRMN